MSGQAERVALVSLTVMENDTVYSDARCPQCNRKLMSMPGEPPLEVRAPRLHGHRLTGRGPVTVCPRCSTLCEVVSHRAAG